VCSRVSEGGWELAPELSGTASTGVGAEVTDGTLYVFMRMLRTKIALRSLSGFRAPHGLRAHAERAARRMPRESARDRKPPFLGVAQSRKSLRHQLKRVQEHRQQLVMARHFEKEHAQRAKIAADGLVAH